MTQLFNQINSLLNKTVKIYTNYPEEFLGVLTSYEHGILLVNDLHITDEAIIAIREVKFKAAPPPSTNELG